MAQRLKRLPAMWEPWVRFLGREDPLEKEMATHSSILAWRIPKTEKPGGLQSRGFAKSRIRLSDFTSLLLHRDCNQQVICLLGSWKLLLVKTKLSIGNSLAVQCLGLCVRFLVWECRFHKPCSMAKHLLKTEKQKQKPT